MNELKIVDSTKKPTVKFNADKIVRAFDQVEKKAEIIQREMLLLLEFASTLDKKSVLSNREIIKVFEHDMKGLDRNRLIAWVSEYSPIRIKTKNNGHFEKLTWSASHVKNAKEQGKDSFNVVSASNSLWYHFEPATTVAVKSSAIDQAVKKLVSEIAKLGHEDHTSIDKVVSALLQDQLASKTLTTAGIEEQCTEKFDTWALAYDVKQEASSRVQEQKAAARKARAAA
jgi:hypothetical protein